VQEIGGVNYEGLYFIVPVSDGWAPPLPLPPESPADRWFEHITTFKAALKGPWIRSPIRRRTDYRTYARQRGAAWAM
jgi:hypothetical protein